jgi:hypothetical protein
MYPTNNFDAVRPSFSSPFFLLPATSPAFRTLADSLLPFSFACIPNPQGTFANFTIDDSPFLLKLTYPPRPPIITALSFSPNGKHLLAITSGHVHYVLDAFSGDTIARLEGGEGLEGKREVESTRGKSGEEGGWSGDGKFVIAGTFSYPPSLSLLLYARRRERGQAEPNVSSALSVLA